MSSAQGRTVHESEAAPAGSRPLNTKHAQQATSPPASEEKRGAFQWSTVIAGGAAGAASRTVVSPLERLKST